MSLAIACIMRIKCFVHFADATLLTCKSTSTRLNVELKQGICIPGIGLVAYNRLDWYVKYKQICAFKKQRSRTKSC